MINIVDLTTQTMGSLNPANTRDVSQIRYIGIHHSATEGGNVFDFEDYWKSIGWRTGGYSEIILRDGTVQLCYDPTVITNGINGYNTPTYHICVVGNGSFTPEQDRVLEERILTNMLRFNIPIDRVLGHNEFPGTNTFCPGRDMNALRQRLTQDVGVQVAHTVVPGESLWTISLLYDVPIVEIQQANGLGTSMYIYPGQVLIIPQVAPPTTSNYFPVPNYWGDSLVEALSTLGVDSSYESRRLIAEVNGVFPYTGSLAQNSILLNLLRQGQLIRP